MHSTLRIWKCFLAFIEESVKESSFLRNSEIFKLHLNNSVKFPAKSDFFLFIFCSNVYYISFGNFKKYMLCYFTGSFRPSYSNIASTMGTTLLKTNGML